jgi:AcrR family transcriptional regulator
MNASTKDKILDTAERLFAEKGVDATSLRHVISEAAVNLAAVHYHFHSKESLLDAIILRKLRPVNEERLAMLNRAELEAGDRCVPVEKILESFFLPAFTMKYRNVQFTRLLGRLQSDGVMKRVMQEHFSDVIERFMSAFRRTTPGLGNAELMWRIHFAIGAMAHALVGGPELAAMGPEASRMDAKEVSRLLVEFTAAGFRAATPEKQEEK